MSYYVMDTDSLGDFVRQRREKLGWEQTDLAERVGIKRAHLSQIETGKIAFPNTDIRRKLALSLGLRHVDLLIAAGELNADEVPIEGAERQPFAHDPMRAKIVTLVADLSDQDAYVALRFIKHMVETE